MSGMNDKSVWTPSGIPYQVQEDGFIYGEFHRLTYAIAFAKALYQTESWTASLLAAAWSVSHFLRR